MESQCPADRPSCKEKYLQVNPLTGELLLGAERSFSFDYTFGQNSHQEEVRFCLQSYSF